MDEIKTNKVNVKSTVYKMLYEMECLKGPRKGFLKKINSKVIIHKNFTELVYVLVFLLAAFLASIYICEGIKLEKEYYMNVGVAIITVLTLFFSIVNFFHIKKEYTYFYEIDNLKCVNEIITLLMYNNLKRINGKKLLFVLIWSILWS